MEEFPEISETATENAKGKGSALLPALLLALGVFFLFLPSVKFDFINLDDQYYVIDNPLIEQGLSWEMVSEGFASQHLEYYIPLTWLSFMADVELSGMSPSGFHRTNVLLHALNALLLFLFLRRATGSIWKSILCAALWAVHPLRVESVAWVTARKDLLSAFFFLLSLNSYAEYAKKRGIGWYFAALATLLLGLLSKPILVVAPLLLLATDFWPLGRLRSGMDSGERKKILLEKVPFFALSAFFSILTLTSQKRALLPDSAAPLINRLSDTATSIVHYLGKTLWPFGLIVTDRAHSPHYTGAWALLAWGLVVLISYAAWKLRKTSPEAAGGWLWYLAALFPVSGIVAVGLNFVADRFTYLPHMGLFAGVVWLAGCAVSRREKLKIPALVAGAVLATGLAAASSVHLRHWKNGLSLFTYTSGVTGGDSFSEANIGSAYILLGELEKAEEHLKKSLAKDPRHPITNHYMGILLYHRRRYPEAIAHQLKTLAGAPDYVDAHYNIALSAIEFGNEEFALSHLGQAVEKSPGFWEAMLLAGQILNRQGRFDEAAEQLSRAKALAPWDPVVESELRTALTQRAAK